MLTISRSLSLGLTFLSLPSLCVAAQANDFGQKARVTQPTQGEAQSARPYRTIAYGHAPLQTLDFWSVAGPKPAPLIILVHGGGFQQGDKTEATGRWKAEHFPEQGYGFASINYRLVPAVTVEQAAQDVADAVKSLIEQAKGLGIDQKRIVLVGHGVGGNLVSLVGTDSRYLNAAGLSLDDIAGVVVIDCAVLDIPLRMRDPGPPLMHKMYRDAFGQDPVRQRALSPTLQAAAPNTNNFLLMSNQGTPGERQAAEFARALSNGGTSVEVKTVPAGEGLLGHDEIIQRLGDPTYAATVIVDDWLKRVFAK